MKKTVLFGLTVVLAAGLTISAAAEGLFDNGKTKASDVNNIKLEVSTTNQKAGAVKITQGQVQFGDKVKLGEYGKDYTLESNTEGITLTVSEESKGQVEAIQAGEIKNVPLASPEDMKLEEK